MTFLSHQQPPNLTKVSFVSSSPNSHWIMHVFFLSILLMSENKCYKSDIYTNFHRYFSRFTVEFEWKFPFFSVLSCVHLTHWFSILCDSWSFKIHTHLCKSIHQFELIYNMVIYSTESIWFIADANHMAVGCWSGLLYDTVHCTMTYYCMNIFLIFAFVHKPMYR